MAGSTEPKRCSTNGVRQEWVWIMLAWGIVGIFIPNQAAQAAPEPGEKLAKVKTFRVFGNDDRQIPSDTTKLPYSAVGMIDARWGASGNYEWRTGTGVMISEKIVLTCGHVIYDSTLGWPESISFIPGKISFNEPYGVIQVQTAQVRQEWLERSDDYYDLGLLLLSDKIGTNTGYLNVVSKSASFFDGRTLSMAGYPGDLLWDHMYVGTGTFRAIDETMIEHYLDGGPGQSGGPIWYTDSTTGQATVVGVYTGDVDLTDATGAIVESYGVGIWLNDTFCNWVKDYVEQNDTTGSIVCDPAAVIPVAPACGLGGPMLLMTLMVLPILYRHRG